MTAPLPRFRAATLTAATALSLIGLATGPVHAAGWPPLQPGARLYTGTGGTGTASTVDLGDVSTCHTLAAAARSVQVASGSASVVLYTGAGCTGAYPWATGSLAQSDTPSPVLSYRVVPA
ncbi:hypothetical protein ACFV1L_24640 [Kitasatospora sp. NPDC059646]|uniref:hypothetical protein n=1 Tax=Kitasatospora sp. NPDC059646 TaxID=3346893 RepID=UPI00369F0FC2